MMNSTNNPSNEPYKLENISHSKADAFRTCAKKWKFQYVETRIRIRANYAPTVGSFVHEVFEEFFHLPAPLRTLEVARMIAKGRFEVFSQEDEMYQLLFLDELGVKQFKKDAWKWIKGLWELEQPTRVDVIEIEHRFTMDINGVPFRGAIDRIESGEKRYVITDYKTGKAPVPMYQDKKLGQILLYSAVTKELFGERPEYAQLLFLGSRIVGVNPTEGKIKREVDKLTETWEDIGKALRNYDFPANPQPLCGWCDYIDICEEGQAYVKDRTLNGPKWRNKPPAIDIIASLNQA